MSSDPHYSTLAHDPTVAPVVQTSPQTLEIADPNDSESPSKSQGQSRVARLSSTIEKTVDKLSKSVGGKSGNSTPSSPSHRRVFSLSKKSRHIPGDESAARQSPDEDPTLTTSSVGTTSTPHQNRSLVVMKSSDKAISMTTAPTDESPFISPPSPPLRPSPTPFRGDGSVRHLTTHATDVID